MMSSYELGLPFFFFFLPPKLILYINWREKEYFKIMKHYFGSYFFLSSLGFPHQHSPQKTPNIELDNLNANVFTNSEENTSDFA